MIIRIPGPGTDPILIDPAEFGRFHVDATGASDPDVAAALERTGLGVFADGHAMVDVDGLRALAGTAVDDSWEAGLAKMLTYATSKGWLDAEGRIQAHVVRE